MSIMDTILFNYLRKVYKKPKCLRIKHQSQLVDIIIVGAGLSGLTTALKVQNRDPTLKIRILEAGDAIGGQLKGNHVRDIGGKWFTEDQQHLQQLLAQLEVPIRKRETAPENFKNISYIGDGLLGSFVKYELKRYINELDMWVHLYKPGIKKCKTSSMQSHIYKRLFFSKSRKYMTNLVLLITGVDAANVKYHEFMSVCYTWGGLKSFINLFIDIPDSLFEFSGKELLNTITKSIHHIEVLYGHQILEVNNLRSHVEMRGTNDQRYHASAVILAMPWHNLQDIKFSPPLPSDLGSTSLYQCKIEKLITGFLAEYKDDKWRKNEFSGNFLCDDPFIVAYEYHNKAIAGYLVHEVGIEINIRTVILEALANTFGDEMLLPIDFQYFSHPLSNTVHAPMSKPWNRVVWSSSAAAATCYRGCLDGAVQSGTRAALNALLITRPQIVTWQDVAEIQCKDDLRGREVSLLSLWLSSWNLYNVTTYSIFISSILLFLSLAYRKIKVH